MTAYQLDASGHRGSQAVKRLVEYAPSSGGLALWMQHRDVDNPPAGASWAFGDTNNRRWIIANDGTTIYYGPGFSNFTLPVQTGLVAHEVLHVALRHSAREQALRDRLGSVDSELFCVCADAIVNTSLTHLSWLELPEGSILLDKLLSNVLGIDQAAEVSLQQWDTESLYRAIDDRQWRGGSSGQSQTSEESTSANHYTQSRNSNSGGTTGHGKGQPASQADRARQGNDDDKETDKPGLGQPASERVDVEQLQHLDGDSSTAARQMASGMIRDLLVSTENLPETEAEQSRQWSDRLTRAHTADGEQSLMRQLLADNRPLKTPWEQSLRTCLQRSLAQKTDLSWSRPSRSWLANRGRTSNGKKMPWQPGTSSTKASPRLCIMVDVSGSVEDKLMERFANEIERVLRLLRCEIYLLIGDETVRHECRLRSDVTALRNVQFQGGGGTDFAPLILAADRLRPDIGIFLTDLDGPAGDEPLWPVVWAIPESAAHCSPPFGRLLVLD